MEERDPISSCPVGNPEKVLLAYADDAFGDRFATVLARDHVTVHALRAADFDETVGRFDGTPTLIVIGPEASLRAGLRLIHYVRARWPRSPILLVTDALSGDEVVALDAQIGPVYAAGGECDIEYLAATAVRLVASADRSHSSG